MATPNASFAAIIILSRTSSYHPMASSPSLLPGTIHRDRTIKLWNTLGECKYDIKEDGHTEWYANSFGHEFQNFDGACRVSCVRFSPNVMNPVIVSCGWDKVVKVRFFFHIMPHPLAPGVML